MALTGRKWPDFEHTGPGTVAGTYLRKYWQPVHTATDVAIGRALPIKIMGQQYTLYRGDSGKAHVVADRCLHRGTLLSTGWVEGDQIRCFYHGWKYNESGQCIERPAERSCPPNLRIRTYPTREWAGLIFAYLGEGEPPFFSELDVFASGGYLTAQALVRQFNYFNQLENSLDEVHILFAHRVSRFAQQGLTNEIPQLTCEETDYGLARCSTRGGVARHNHFMMPNANIALLFGAWHLVWRVPIDDVSHISFTVDYFEGTPQEIERYRAEREDEAARIATAPPAAELVEDVLAGRRRLEDLVDHPDLLSIQDGVALKGQGVIADREKELLGQSDAQIVRMRRLWVQDLTAMEEGKAPRDWRWPRSLEVTSGLAVDAGAV